MTASTPDWQQQAQVHFLQGNYNEAASLYEQVIATEPHIKSHYWQLGLLLLLQGQEEEAQIVWFDALASADSEAEMQAWITELVTILHIEAQKLEQCFDYQTAWLIRQHIYENQPENLDNLLRSLLLATKLKLSDLDKNTHLQQVTELLPHISPTQIDAVLLLQVLQQMLAIADDSPSISEFADACISHYQAALVIQPTDAELHYRLGNIYAEIKRTELAIASYNQALQLQPKYAEPYFSLGNIDLNRAAYEQAISKYQRAIELDPTLIKAYVNLAYIQEQLGNLEAAIHTLQAGIAQNAGFAPAYRNLGNLLLKCNQLAESTSALRLALTLSPDDVSARTNLVAVLIRQNQLDQAIACLEEAPISHIDYASAYYDIGNAMLYEGKHIEAGVCFELALDIQPNYAKAYCGLGAVLMQRVKIDEAIAKYQKALAIEPNNAEVHASIGQAKALQGKTDEAIDYYQQALNINPQQVSAYHTHLILPILYDDKPQIQQWRQRYIQGLQTFTKLVSDHLATNPRLALACIGYKTNFYLAYQEQNDLALQSQYGQLVHQIMATNYPQWAEPIPMTPLEANGKIRIGYISEFFRSHSVGNMTIGWLRYCDRSAFEIYTYYTSTKVDAVTKEFEQYSDYFYQIPNTDLETICNQIRADQLHILVFPDIGMQPQTTQVAALRLAPVQCVWAGHPVTTGLPTMDYFLSSDMMEPEEAQSHYSEQLVRLPKLGFSYTKLPLPKKLQSRTDLQLPEDCVLYLSCQTLFKYLPQYDYIFAELAARVPHAKIAFFGRTEDNYLTEKLNRRLSKAFEQVGLDMEKFCLMLPRLAWEEYMNWLLIADVSLDTIGFSGGNTTLQAIACNLPVVTLPSEFMRGRVSYGAMKTLGVTDTVAFSEDEYIKIAVKLGLDPQWRKQIVEKISSQHNQLFDDQVEIAALEEFYKEAVTSFSFKTSKMGTS